MLYTPERLAEVATEAAKGDSSFSVNDRIGLVNDAMALAKAGFSNTSSALTLVNILRYEQECWLPCYPYHPPTNICGSQSWFGIVSLQICRP